MSKESEKRQRAVITAQGQLDNAPSSGKGTYLKLLEGLKFFEPEKNKTYKLLFLPWKAGKFNPTGREGNWVTNRYIPVHRGVGPADETFICSMRAFGKPCAGCEEFAAQRSKGADWDKVLKHLKFKDRELFFVHDLDVPQSLLVWDESIHLFGDAFRMKFRKKKEWMSFADFEQGCIVEIEGKEKKIGASSCVDCTLGIEMEPLKRPFDDFLVKAAETLCIDNCVVEVPYAKLKKLYVSLPGPEEKIQEEETTTPTEPEERAEETTTEPEPEEVEEEVVEDDDIPFKLGDRVSFDLKGKETFGSIYALENGEAKVNDPLASKNYKLKLEKLTLVQEKTEEEIVEEIEEEIEEVIPEEEEAVVEEVEEAPKTTRTRRKK